MVLPDALPDAVWAQSLKQRQQQGKSLSGSPVKSKFLSLFIVVVIVVLSLVISTLAADPASNSSQTRSITATELMAWLIAGVPSNRLVRLLEERGVTGIATKEQMQQLQSAGADANLIATLAYVKAPASTTGAAPIPLSLLSAAVEARALHYHAAELRPSTRSRKRRA